MSPRRAPFTLEIPDYWTPQQALAVFELLKDLMDAIWDRYELTLIEMLAGEIYQDDTQQLDLFDFDDSVPF